MWVLIWFVITFGPDDTSFFSATSGSASGFESLELCERAGKAFAAGLKENEFARIGCAPLKLPKVAEN